MRIYDPRLGKFLSVDPLSSKFPWWTPYAFAGNSPIEAIDLDGGEIKTVILELALNRDKTTFVKSAEVSIDPNVKFTDANGNKAARTDVYTVYNGKVVSVTETYEPINGNEVV